MLLLFNTTRMVPGPPSTGVAIAMDGGMNEIRARGVHAVSFYTLFTCPGSPRCLFTGYELGTYSAL